NDDALIPARQRTERIVIYHSRSFELRLRTIVAFDPGVEFALASDRLAANARSPRFLLQASLEVDADHVVAIERISLAMRDKDQGLSVVVVDARGFAESHDAERCALVVQELELEFVGAAVPDLHLIRTGACAGNDPVEIDRGVLRDSTSSMDVLRI